MSRQLFINNADAVPAADPSITDPSEVPEATIVAFDADDFASGTLDLTTATDAKNVVFVQGGKTGDDAIISSIIPVDKVHFAKKVKYVAPVAQVTTVTAEEGTGFAMIRLVRVDTGYQPYERLTAEVKLDDYADASAIATALANQINNSNHDFVTATTSGADLVLTGSEEASFETATDGEAAAWDIVATTARNEGTGTSKQVKNLEEIAWGANYYNRVYLPITPPSYVEDGSNYDITTIEVRTNTTANIAKSNMYQKIDFAVITGGTDPAGIDLEAFFGL